MVIYKRKKNTRQRGSHTHGWGSKKKHRGSGHRGGRGMAGTGKRADTKKPSIWGERYFGKFGFKKKGIKKEIKPVNIVYFEENLDKLLSKKLIEKENDKYIIDLKKLGFNKLLGKGKLTKKFIITADYASKHVVEEIKNAGGEVIISKKEEAPANAQKGTAEKKPEVE